MTQCHVSISKDAALRHIAVRNSWKPKHLLEAPLQLDDDIIYIPAIILTFHTEKLLGIYRKEGFIFCYHLH